MNTKTMKILITVFSVMTIIAMLSTTVFALTPSDMDTYMNNSSANVDGITGLGGSIMKILQTVGIVVAVVILMVLGIKYMMGSAEEKAEYKKTMMPYIIGALLIFGATTIATMIYNFTTGI